MALIGPIFFEEHLTRQVSTKFLRNELPGPLEGIPIFTRQQMIFQHDEAPADFSPLAKGYPNKKYNNK